MDKKPLPELETDQEKAVRFFKRYCKQLQTLKSQTDKMVQEFNQFENEMIKSGGFPLAISVSFCKGRLVLMNTLLNQEVEVYKSVVVGFKGELDN